MKTIFRSIGLAMLAALFIAASSGTSFAQAGCDDIDGMNALDATIRANYPKNSTVKAAIDAGKSYLEKYGSCEVAKEFVDWLKVQMPKWEDRYKKWMLDQKMGELFSKFDKGIDNKKYDDVYSAGPEILAVEPDNVHVMIPLGLIGLTTNAEKNTRFNDDTLKYARLAIAKLKAGAQSKMKDGKPVLNAKGQPAYSTWNLSKEEAIDDLTYSVAFLTYAAKNDKKTALPLFYELSQSSGTYKTDPRVYAAIGDYYVGEKNRLGQEVQAMIEKQKTLATDEEKVKMEGDIKAKVGLFNGYAERALDAYGRAHKVATDEAYKKSIMAIIQDIYKQRFDDDTAMAKMNGYLATTTAKPFPSPLSEVTPIIDPDPVTTTTSGVGAASGNGIGAASGTGMGAASGNGMGAASGNGVGARSVATSPAPKPVATQATKKP